MHRVLVEHEEQLVLVTVCRIFYLNWVGVVYRRQGSDELFVHLANHLQAPEQTVVKFEGHSKEAFGSCPEKHTYQYRLYDTDVSYGSIGMQITSSVRLN